MNGRGVPTSALQRPIKFSGVLVEASILSRDEVVYHEFVVFVCMEIWPHAGFCHVAIWF